MWLSVFTSALWNVSNSFLQPVKDLLGDCQQTTRILHDLEKIKFKEILGIRHKKMSVIDESYADSLEKCKTFYSDFFHFLHYLYDDIDSLTNKNAY